MLPHLPPSGGNAENEGSGPKPDTLQQKSDDQQAYITDMGNLKSDTDSDLGGADYLGGPQPVSFSDNGTIMNGFVA
jgi:hypothetical protein